MLSSSGNLPSSVSDFPYALQAKAEVLKRSSRFGDETAILEKVLDFGETASILEDSNVSFLHSNLNVSVRRSFILHIIDLLSIQQSKKEKEGGKKKHCIVFTF